MTRHLSAFPRAALLALATAAVVAISGCAKSTYLSAASSMRIEVDVYKGPLSNSAEVQKGQLSALLRATRSSINHMDGLLIDSMCRVGCIRGDGQIDFGTPGETLPAPWLTAPYTAPLPRDREFWFRPSAEFCANRGIPQRRILKNSPPCVTESSCDRDDKYNDPLSQKGGVTSDRYATDNTRHRLEADSRFPESGDDTYRTCPVYISMREQIRNLKEASCVSTQKLAGQPTDVCKDVDLWFQTASDPFVFRQAAGPSSPAAKALTSETAKLRRAAVESLQEPRQLLEQKAAELTRTIRDSGDAEKLLLALNDAEAALVSVRNGAPSPAMISGFGSRIATLARSPAPAVTATMSPASVDQLLVDAESWQEEGDRLTTFLSGIAAPLDAVAAAIKVAEQTPIGKSLPLAARNRPVLDRTRTSVATLAEASSAFTLQARTLVDVLKPVVAAHLASPAKPRALSAQEVADARKAVAAILAHAKEMMRATGSPAPSSATLGGVMKEVAALATATRGKVSKTGFDALKKQRDGVLAALKGLDDTAGHLDELPSERDNANAEMAALDIDSYAGIAELATGFRVLAATISYGLAATLPTEARLRIDMVKVANLSAEFANQFTARANALHLQTGVDGVDRRVLPTGQYLRDSQPTAFLDAYEWHNAATEYIDNSKDRVQVAKRLFADDNWARVNEVYASGSGDVSMAFIRDDIGNWNLKQFSSDASELTAAYTKLGLDLVGKVAGLAAGGGPTALAKATGALAAAQDVQAGTAANSDLRSGTLIANLDLSATRKDLSGSLTEIQQSLKKEVALIRENKRRGDPETPLCPDATDTDLDACRAAREAEAVARAKVSVDAVVQQYELLIDAFQRVAAVPSSTAEQK
jgi:hypothetical protein